MGWGGLGNECESKQNDLVHCLLCVYSVLPLFHCMTHSVCVWDARAHMVSLMTFSVHSTFADTHLLIVKPCLRSRASGTVRSITAYLHEVIGQCE